LRCMKSLLPSKEKYVRAVYLAKPWEEVVYDIETNKIKNIKHIRILELLAENEYIPVGDIVRFVGVSAGVLDTFKKEGIFGV